MSDKDIIYGRPLIRSKLRATIPVINLESQESYFCSGVRLFYQRLHRECRDRESASNDEGRRQTERGATYSRRGCSASGPGLLIHP